jgi:hypothetical protein
MKRRTFNQAALASLLCGFSMPINSGIQRDRPTKLSCLRQPKRILMDERSQETCSFTIGIGRSGSRLAAQLHAAVDQQQQALIYTDACETPQAAFATSCERASVPLTIARSGVLLLSLNETDAWSLALSWARRMREEDVFLTAAVLCVDDIETGYAHPFTAELRRHLDCVILQNSPGSTCGIQGIDPAAQSARLFFMEHGLIGWDICDLRTILGGRITCATTSLITPPGDECSQEGAVDACYSQFNGIAVDGGIGHWIAGIDDLSVAAFSTILDRLQALPTMDVPILFSSVDLLSHPGIPSLLHMIWTIPEGATV